MNHPARWIRDEDLLRSALRKLGAIRGRSVESLTEHPGPDARVLTIETTTYEGMHSVVHATGELTEEETADVRSLVRALLDLLGHEYGRARIEIVVTQSGPRILDCWFLSRYL